MVSTAFMFLLMFDFNYSNGSVSKSLGSTSVINYLKLSNPKLYTGYGGGGGGDDDGSDGKLIIKI